MSAFRFSNRAHADLAEIVQFTIRTWNDEQAEKYLRLLEIECEHLVEQPRAGRPCNHIRPGLWRARAGSHVLFFRREGADILVCRILHYRMLPEHQPIDDTDSQTAR